MSWQFLVAISVLLFSINGLLHRVLMKDDTSDAYTQTVLFSALTGLFAFIIVVFRGGLQPFFSFDQLILFIPMVILGASATIFTFKGMKLIEASEHTILLTSSRLWFITGAIVFLGESLTLLKFLGAIAILSGVTVSQWKKGKFVLNSGAIYVLLAAFGYAVADIISFFILRNFDALSYIVYSSIFIVSVLLLIRPNTIQKLSFYFQPRRAANITIVSFNDTIASLCAFLAYQVGRNALQIGPLMATQTIVTVLLALIILKERENMPQKIAGALIVVFGTMLLV